MRGWRELSLIGSQVPHLHSEVPAPGYIDGTLDYASGEQAVSFCQWAGMTLFPWQEDLLRESRATAMFENPDNPSLSEKRLAFPEGVFVVSRQNGKGEYLIGLELSAIYLNDSPISVLHTAHYTSTALSALQRTWDIVSESPNLMQWAPWVKKYGAGRLSEPKQIVSNGKEGIVFPNGSSISFRTRSGTQGAGTSNDLLILDECFDLPEGTADALTYTTRARKNAQTIYISSPVNINNPKHLHGVKFSSKRWAGIDETPGVLFKEWSLPEGMDPLTREAWVVTNPSLITSGEVGKQYRPVEAGAAAARSSESELSSFLVEDLGTGNWYPRDGVLSEKFVPVIDPDKWVRRASDNPERASGVPCIAVDLDPSGESVAVVVAARTSTGIDLSMHPVEEFDREEVAKIIHSVWEKESDGNDRPLVVMEPINRNVTIEHPLEKLGVEMTLMKSGANVAEATETFLQLVREEKITHDNDPRWAEALKVAKKSRVGKYGDRIIGDGGAVCSLVAAAYAVWGLHKLDSPDGKRPRFVGKARPVRASRPGRSSVLSVSRADY